MKDFNCKSTLVNDKVVDRSMVTFNPCVPVSLDLFNEVVESQLIACYNCINVDLRHSDPVRLTLYSELFREFVTPRVTLIVFQRCGVHVCRYTVVTNKDMRHIHSILFDFEKTTCDDPDFRMEY